MNNKGFTLIEVLAVIVLLSIIMAIAAPNVTYLIEKNKNDNYEELKTTITNAAKMYLSDNRYQISISGTCTNKNETKPVLKVANTTLSNSKLLVQTLVTEGNIKTDANGNITNPKKTNQTLDLNRSYVLVQYKCLTKDYTYQLASDSLVWK